MFPESVPADAANPRARIAPARRRSRPIIAIVITIFALTLVGARLRNPSAFRSSHLTEAALDDKLQHAALAALGDRRGTVIVMDPQTGRVRAIVNPKLAVEENLPPGSTVKPFTALTALRDGLIDDDVRTACGEEYTHDDFHTVCSHPRGLPPLGLSDAIAYSCNYYFGRLGDRLSEPSFVATLNQFGFGRKTGINADDESAGRLLRNGWRPQNAIGEGDKVLVTPIQLINAYAALVNGGHLLTPRIAAAESFSPVVQANLVITDDARNTIIKGMRGAVTYGTAETANLYKLPAYVFGKTGTATQINGYRSQGWFVGFATSPNADEKDASPTRPEQIKLAVLVFLTRAHGSEAAEIARPIFEEFAHAPTTNPTVAPPIAGAPKSTDPEAVRIHRVRENVTETVSIEDYVRGVVATEGSTENELEALKALAIASRTYAIRNIGRHGKDGYDFCSTTHCQRYSSTASPASALVQEAVDSTRGEILRDASNEVVDSYFSASCGGATANMGTLWGKSSPPYLRGVPDDSCADGPHHSWTDVVPVSKLAKALQSDPRTNVGSQLHGVTVLRRDQSDRAELIAIEGSRRSVISGWEFKIVVGRALGWNVLKSSRFEITRSGENFVFRGQGFGHGLGLCQEGAHAMAERGSNHQQILAKYFPTTHIAGRNGAADLLWGVDSSAWMTNPLPAPVSRQTLSSENFRINYPATINRRQIEGLLDLLQSTRKSLLERVASAGLSTRFPAIEVFVNESTGDFVGRTGQPPWAAAATKDQRIEIQPLPTLKRRRILESTLRHELVHTLIDSLGHGRTPRWLAEGLAIHLAGEGPLVSRYQPRHPITLPEVEQRLTRAQSAEDMKAAYAAAYAETVRLIKNEGETAVWRRVASSY